MPPSNNPSRATADELFQAELASRGLQYEITGEGLITAIGSVATKGG